MKRRLIPIGMLLLVRVAHTQDAALLSPGSPLEREIQAGQVHSYRMAVHQGDFVYVTAAQLGSDVAIRLTQPGGTRYAEVDRLPYEGFEDVPWIAPAAGEITIEIRARARSATGHYRLEVAVRVPTEKDRSLTAAFVAAWIDAEALQAKRTVAASREAAAKYELAATEARKAGDPRWEAYAFSEWAQVINQFGEFAKARDLLQKSFELQRTFDERYSLSVSLNGLGATISSLGDTQRALDFYEQSLEIRRQVGDRAGQAVLLNNLGNAYKNLSNYPKAIECLTQSVSLRKEVGDRVGEALTVSNLGSVYFVAGDYQAALDLYMEARDLRAGLNDKKALAGSAHSLGGVYYAMGNSALAQQYWKEAESIFREVGANPELANVRYAMGMERARQGDHRAAIRYLEDALALQRGMSLGVPFANDLSAVCRSHLAVGDVEKAEARASEGLEVSRKINYASGVGSSTECLGRIALSKGNVDAARSHFAEALQLSRTTTSRDNQSQALAGLASVERRSGRLVEALQYSEQVTALAEVGRAQVLDPNLRAMYRASRSRPIDFQLGLLMEMHAQQPDQGYQERAFNLSEHWQARSLQEMIAENRTELRQELTAEQRQREDRVLRTISRVQRDLFQQGIAAQKQRDLKVELSTAERELDLFQNELERQGNRYVKAQYSEGLNAQQIRAQLLPPGTALIEYALGETNSYAWVLTQAGVSSSLLAPRMQMEQSIQSYRNLLAEPVTALTSGSALARIDAESRKLYRMLVEPLEGSLGSVKRVIIVPDGALAYLPFETLGGTSRLIERFSISYAPSASTLAALQQREQRRVSPERTLLAFADPVFEVARNPSTRVAAYRDSGFAFTRLPNSRQEVEGIRALFGPANSHVHLGSDASEHSLRLEKLDAYRYLHFAVHGYFDEEQPSRSGIVLSFEKDGANDGILQSPEIMRLVLNADMVTLSACQTGLGAILAGEGVMGLTRAFLYAGAQSLVVSLWSVNDAATADLMKRFYANLKAGMPRDEALRQAKLSLLRATSPQWRNPHFWAPFVLVGDIGTQRPPSVIR